MLKFLIINILSGLLIGCSTTSETQYKNPIDEPKKDVYIEFLNGQFIQRTVE